MNKKINTLKNGLGNGLIVKYDGQNLELDGIDSLGLKLRGMHKYTIPIQNVTPHYFPLDHLTKPIRVEGYNDGELFTPMFELLKIKTKRLKLQEPVIKITVPYLVKYFWVETRVSHKYGKETVNVILVGSFDSWECWIVELLHKWHFNVFNLDPSDYIDASQSQVYTPK